MGCPKNEADSDTFAGILKAAGWRLTDTPDEACMLLLNTCAFIDPAIAESMEAVKEALDWKQSVEGRILILAGCLPSRFPDDGSGGLEEFDLVMGAADNAALAGYLSNDAIVPLPSGSGTNRYLRISEGCSNGCRYCTIPLIRGRHIPRDPAEIIRDCSILVSQGALEIGIVGQDTGAWSCGDGDIAWLLPKLAREHPSVWFRLYYVHPSHFPKDLIRVIHDEPNVVPYIELPVQHASDAVLRRMGRPYDRMMLDALFDSLDALQEPPAVRTSVITGYPGETEEDFQQLIDFLTSHRCIRTICAFPYWPEEGTAEFARTGRAGVPDASTVQSRLAAVGDAGQACQLVWADRLEGNVIEILADTSESGHSVYDAPAVDGASIFSSPAGPGAIILCTVDECVGADMLVTPVR